MDAAFEHDFEEELQALATTDMASDTIRNLLNSGREPLNWEIGEGIAECLLTDELGVVWPWNENRDQKTPGASLPGADLVGFLKSGDDVMFLFGEVKTSSDTSAPPNVLFGRSGLVHQIDTLANATRVHFSLLKWLRARCTGNEFEPLYQEAATRYIHSKGRDIALAGILLRDTGVNEDDLRSRGEALVGVTQGVMRVRLDAWYLPRSVEDWGAIIKSAAA
ncbi:hypothetical protein [Microvirga sp. BSC39]|uniref:hypothetical protein n=1 Tax=Microvirga sp. BSC39 TaxID=1549810 RepID=UPI001269D1F5|nr:hypothetical protein [Microvirga sp. BSC39]